MVTTWSLVCKCSDIRDKIASTLVVAWYRVPGVFRIILCSPPGSVTQCAWHWQAWRGRSARASGLQYVYDLGITLVDPALLPCCSAFGYRQAYPLPYL